jgi:hypothetical protein
MAIIDCVSVHGSASFYSLATAGLREREWVAQTARSERYKRLKKKFLTLFLEFH